MWLLSLVVYDGELLPVVHLDRVRYPVDVDQAVVLVTELKIELLYLSHILVLLDVVLVGHDGNNYLPFGLCLVDVDSDSTHGRVVVYSHMIHVHDSSQQPPTTDDQGLVE